MGWMVSSVKLLGIRSEPKPLGGFRSVYSLLVTYANGQRRIHEYRYNEIPQSYLKML